MNDSKLLAALKLVEWTWDSGKRTLVCPECGYSRLHGHSDECNLNDVLANAAQELPHDHQN